MTPFDSTTVRCRSLCAGCLKTGKQIAVKTCSAKVEQESFLKEISMMTTLDHPHIVKLYGVCTKAGSDMLVVMELMANGDLRHFLINDSGDTIHIVDLIRFLEQVTVLANAKAYIAPQAAYCSCSSAIFVSQTELAVQARAHGP